MVVGANSELVSEDSSFVKLLFDPVCCHTGQTRVHGENVRIVELCTTCDFLATLVALHLTPVSVSVAGQSFGWRPSSIAWSLRACCFRFLLFLLLLFFVVFLKSGAFCLAATATATIQRRLFSFSLDFCFLLLLFVVVVVFLGLF